MRKRIMYPISSHSQPPVLLTSSFQILTRVIERGGNDFTDSNFVYKNLFRHSNACNVQYNLDVTNSERQQ